VSIIDSTASRLRTSQGRAWIGPWTSSGLCLLENIFAAAADIDGGAQLEEAVRHGFAEAGAATGNEDALGMEKIVTKHACSGSDEMTANAGSSPGLRPLSDDK